MQDSDLILSTLKTNYCYYHIKVSKRRTPCIILFILINYFVSLIAAWASYAKRLLPPSEDVYIRPQLITTIWYDQSVCIHYKHIRTSACFTRGNR